jgi:hypothetical protein
MEHTIVTTETNGHLKSKCACGAKQKHGRDSRKEFKATEWSKAHMGKAKRLG